MSAPVEGPRGPAAGRPRRFGAAAASLAVSAAGLAYAFHGVAWDGFREAVRAADYRLVAAGAAIAFATHLVRAWRWRLLFGRTRPSLLDTLLGTLIGFFFTGILPLRAGEAVRPWVVSRRAGIPFLRSAATVATERLLDAATVLGLFLLSCLLLPPGAAGGPALDVATRGGAAVALLLGVLALLAVLAEPVAVRVAALPPAAVREAILGGVRSFSGGLRAAGETPGSLAAAAAASLVLWTASALSYHVVLLGFSDSAGPVAPRLGWTGALFLQGVLVLAVALPAAPAFVGTFQAGAAFALDLLGVDAATAGAFAVVYPLATWIPTIVAGALSIPAGGLGFRAWRRLPGAPPAGA